MFAKYVYNAGSTAANVIGDIAAILCGETNKVNLSASCNKDATLIEAGYAPAGWTMHDAAAGGTVFKAIKAPIVDKPTQFKYVSFDTINGSFCNLNLSEGWNATNHTASNMAYNQGNSNIYQRMDLTNGGTMILHASERHILALSSTGGGVGSVSQTPLCVFEHTRWSPWDTAGANYLPACISHQWDGFMGRQDGYSANWPRRRGLSGDLTGVNAKGFVRHPFSTQYANANTSNQSPVLSNAKIPDANGDYVLPMFPFYAHAHHNGDLGGAITELCDIWMIPANYVAMFDEFVLNGKTYVVLALPSGARFAVPKG